MQIERLRVGCALLTALALAGHGCTDDGADELGAGSQALVGPPGAASEVVFPREYTDILIGRGIRTVTSTRLPGSCVELPENVRYQVTNRAWRSEGAAVANQSEFAQKFSMEANLSVAHGPASANLGMQAMRESEWSSTSMKLVIKVVYTYDVIVINPDTATLTQAAHNLIAPPGGADNQAQRDARARAFLKACGRYWTKGVKKGAELALVYSFAHTTRAQREALTGTAGASVPGTNTVGGQVTATQQQSFRTAVQGARLRVYGHGFKINAGDPITPIQQAMDPGANDQLTSLVGFFNDIKDSVNDNYETDGLVNVNPITSNTDAWKIALIGQYYHPLFRNPRVGGPAAAWAANAQTDLMGQDNALYNTIVAYTDFLRDARSAERTANFIRGLAADGKYNFETNPEHDISPLQTRIDRLRDTVRVAENATGPLQRNVGDGLNTDAQESGYWARQCWNLVEIGNEDDSCYAAGPFLARARAALAAFRAGLPKPLNFFSVWWRGDFVNWYGPYKSEGTWRWANQVCTEHKDYRRNGVLGLRLPTEGEIDAFGAFLSGTPRHMDGQPGMDFSRKYLWEQTRFKAWEWTAPGWTWHDHSAWNASNPDYPWACIRPAGPFAMPFIMF